MKSINKVGATLNEQLCIASETRAKLCKEFARDKSSFKAIYKQWAQKNIAQRLGDTNWIDEKTPKSFKTSERFASLYNFFFSLVIGKPESQEQNLS